MWKYTNRGKHVSLYYNVQTRLFCRNDEYKQINAMLPYGYSIIGVAGASIIAFLLTVFD